MTNRSDNVMTKAVNTWSRWPEFRPARIPSLSDRPAYDTSVGLEEKDRPWKRKLVYRIIRGDLIHPNREQPASGEARAAIDEVAYRAYHVARILQHAFNNTNHGNYADPFVESLFILLTWRSRITDAHSILRRFHREFTGPTEMLDARGRKRTKRIVERIGFTGKRPEMIADLIRRFVSRFEDGNVQLMKDWTDEEVINFLTGIPGIGHKSSLCVLMYSLGRDRFPIDAHVRRVLRRTGLIRELYEEHGQKEHRQYQIEAEPFVPPSVRKTLHAGLLAVGQQFCRPRRPRCGDCPLSNVCRHRRKELARISEGRRLTHIEMFAGAGGLGIGFEQEGFRTVLAADKDRNAARTYRINRPAIPESSIFTIDLAEVGLAEIRERLGERSRQLNRGEVQVITAGIPCQGFSKAGYRSRPDKGYSVQTDPRNLLFRIVISWTNELRPSYVVIENVPDMRSAGEGEGNILKSITGGFEDIGYAVSIGTVNAVDFGVSQIRRRLIFIASHPEVTAANVEELANFHKATKHLLEAIGDLSELPTRAGKWYSQINGRIVTGHRARYNNPDDLKIFEAIRPGERYLDFVSRRRDIIEERRQRSARAVYSTASFADKYYKLEPSKPSRTIVAHLSRDGNGYIHPEQTRSITPREAARIQGFDDNFVFAGSQTAQFIQIGNAVPPPVARAIARMLAGKLVRSSS